jgi:hypothetical protein
MSQRPLLRLSALFFLVVMVSACTAPSGYFGASAWNHLVLMIWKISPEQQAEAEKKVTLYQTAVKHKRRAPAKSRYIAVQTLDPTPKQKATYLKKREAQRELDKSQGFLTSPQWTDPDKLHCLMVFDTESKRFVGSGCYVVSTLPPDGQVAKFEAHSAEFVGIGNQ